MSGKKILGQEPAFLTSFIEAGLMMLLTFGVPGLNQDTVGVIVAAVTAVFAVVTAYATKTTLFSALVGLGKALLVLAVTFGAPLDANEQGALLTFVTLAIGLLLRQQTSSTDTAISNASPGANLGPSVPVVVQAQPVVDEAGAIDLLVAGFMVVFSLATGIGLAAGWTAGLFTLAILLLVSAYFWHRHSRHLLEHQPPERVTVS